MVLKIARFANLFLVALLAGLLVGVFIVELALAERGHEVPSSRSPLDGSTVLITGASSGIGLELARSLAPKARSLVAVARRTERLEVLKTELSAKHAGLVVRTEPCALSDPGAVHALLGRPA
jgi:NADPH:quinone reductase-like Zn-dependent oxidoreductase